MTSKPPFSSPLFNISAADRERLEAFAGRVQTFAADAVATTAELGRQTLDGMREASVGSRQQVADLAVEALDETSEQLRRLASGVKEAAEPTAEQVTVAVDQLVTWLDAVREGLVADIGDRLNRQEAQGAPAAPAK
jgi:hypothetical protein